MCEGVKNNKKISILITFKDIEPEKDTDFLRLAGILPIKIKSVKSFPQIKTRKDGLIVWDILPKPIALAGNTKITDFTTILLMVRHMFANRPLLFSCINIVGSLFQNKNVEIIFSGGQVLKTFDLMLNSYDRSWINVDRNDAKKFNSILIDIKDILKPKTISVKSDYKEMKNKLTEKGFIL